MEENTLSVLQIAPGQYPKQVEMFLVTFLVLNTGRTEQELENNVFQALGT